MNFLDALAGLILTVFTAILVLAVVFGWSFMVLTNHPTLLRVAVWASPFVAAVVWAVWRLFR